ncbi:MAG TPA: mechanosensitive ion channel [Anaerolineaceae bacterium]|nr:mechanosensitive ion channel [Anaerolineaceae bacterium]
MPDSLSQLAANVIAFLPTLLAAILILVVGWIVAALVSRLVANLLHRTTLDDRIARSLRGGTPEQFPVERWISTVVFWLIMAFVIVIFLQTLNLGQISDPLNQLLAQILGFIPNLVAAALLTLVAFVVATVLRMIITRVLASSLFTQRVADQAQVETSRTNIGQSIGTVVYWLVLLLFLPAILDTLNLGGILAPIQGMVDRILSALPNILGFAIVLIVGWLIARIARQIVTALLAGIGFDRLFGPSGVIPVTGVATYPTTAERPVPPRRPGEPGAVTMARTSPSDIVGYIVMIAIILFAVMEASNLLGFATLTSLVGTFIVATWNVLIGLIIFGVGLYLSQLADRMIRSTGTSQSNILAPAARVAILIFSGALALRQMGLGESIVNLAFGLLLGAVAIAAALAFGLGGRDVAASQLERWRDNIEVEAKKPPRPAPPPPSVPRATPPPTTPTPPEDIPGPSNI